MPGETSDPNAQPNKPADAPDYQMDSGPINMPPLKGPGRPRVSAYQSQRNAEAASANNIVVKPGTFEPIDASGLVPPFLTPPETKPPVIADNPNNEWHVEKPTDQGQTPQQPK